MPSSKKLTEKELGTTLTWLGDSDLYRLCKGKTTPQLRLINALDVGIW